MISRLRGTAAQVLFVVLCLVPMVVTGQQSRELSGSVSDPQDRFVPSVTITIHTAGQTIAGVTDADGRFSFVIPAAPATVTFAGKNVRPAIRMFTATDATTDLDIEIGYLIPPIAESVTIRSEALTPQIDFRNDALYENTLFGRDDQLIHTLNAGVNAGQHEGGGKSLEIRRYGFNLDHGGVNGGLKFVVDNVQQNQGTQGHGQGYLGALKSLSPELVEDVSVINGPFSAAYGDFSGLGVVQIRQREELPQAFTARVQGGPFNTFRGFFAVSPAWRKISSFIAYEPSYTDGPFESPLRYRRHNASGNLTYRRTDKQAFGFKFNAGTNSFFSSGQIPLDLVAAGELDRFGFIDPENGGKVQAGTLAGYFRQEMEGGGIIRADAFIGRSLLDLFSNFTFFLTDPIYGDEIQQHDSRLQQGGNLQYLQPYKVLGAPSLVTAGFNIHATQVNVGLYPSASRSPDRKFLPDNLSNPDVLLTSAHARINNYAGYVQNETNLFEGHLRIEAGLRFDYFSFDVEGFELRDARRDIFADEAKGVLQPKLGIAWSPFDRAPVSFYANYGRGILSQDARGIARLPEGPKIATTDFFQAGASFNSRRVSAVFSSFLIDRSNEQVYIPDDGTVELAGPTRSYGAEARTTVRLTRSLSFNGGVTKVIRAYYPGEFTADGRRVTVRGAPHLVANGGLVLSCMKGFTASLSWRHASRYRLDGEDPPVKASGSDVVDFAASKQVNRWLRLNLAADNLLNKKYYETQNYFESRTCANCPVSPRIHATPGYPFTVSIGATLTIGTKY